MATTSLALTDVLLAVGNPRGDRDLRLAAKIVASMIRDARVSLLGRHALMDALRPRLIDRWSTGNQASRERAASDVDLLVSLVNERLRAPVGPPP
jgi:hypothetical protein